MSPRLHAFRSVSLYCMKRRLRFQKMTLAPVFKSYHFTVYSLYTQPGYTAGKKVGFLKDDTLEPVFKRLRFSEAPASCCQARERPKCNNSVLLQRQNEALIRIPSWAASIPSAHKREMPIFPFWPCPSVLQFTTEKTLGRDAETRLPIIYHSKGAISSNLARTQCTYKTWHYAVGSIMLNKCTSQRWSACFALNAVHSLKFQPVLFLSYKLLNFIRFKLLLLFYQPPRTFPLTSLPVSFQVHLLSSLPDGTQRTEWLRGPTWGDSGEPDVPDYLGTLALSTGAEDGEEIGEGLFFVVFFPFVVFDFSVCLDFLHKPVF